VNGTFGTGLYTLNGTKLYLNYLTALQAVSGFGSQNIQGSGVIELNSAQPINASANWGPNSSTGTPFSGSFTGTLQIDNGRFDAPPGGLGGVTNIIIKTNGGQFLAWSGTYNVPISIAGQSGWGEVGYPDALRSAGSVTATWNGNVALTADSGIMAQRLSTFTIGGSISGPYQCEFHTGDGVTPASGLLYVTPTAAAQNSYGSTLISGGGLPGAVIAGNQYALSTGGLMMTTLGTLELNGSSFAFANLSGTNGTIGNYAGAGSNVVMTVGSDGTSASYAGKLVDGGVSTLAFTKIGAGSLYLAGANTYTGPTTVSNGVLLVTGSLGASAVAVEALGTLRGTGVISGPVTVDATLWPGGSIGTLAISNVLNLNASSTTIIEMDRSQGTNTFDQMVGITTANLNGTLLVTNLAGTFQGGEAYRLISAGSYGGNFTSVVLPPLGGGLAWSNSLATDGTIRVLATVSITPTYLTNKLSGNKLSLSWPADHTGWSLQSQTNPMPNGLTTNWGTVPGSTTTNAMDFNVDPTRGSVFYRLHYQY
jgi:autotransporter-associated beta strand protein